MRKLKACIHIQAPIHTVRSLTEAPRRCEWMTIRSGSWFKTLHESWEASEIDGGTRLLVDLHYQAKMPFLDPLLGDGFQQSVSHSLSRLKQLAEATLH